MIFAALESTALPIALAWEQPWLLLWGAAATLPLLIHLLSRRRYQTTPCAAMEFLLAAARKQSRRVRLENWLLLILRTLIILLFVAILAGPYEESPQTVAPEDQRVHTIYVLDGSFSMGQTSDGKTLFESAKDTMAREIASDRRREDAFSLVLMAAPARSVVKTPSTDRRALASVISQLELPHGRADLPGALALVRDMLAAAPRAWPPLVRQEVVFLTDLGRNTWSPGDASAAARSHPLATQLAALAEDAEVRIVELGTRGAANLAVTHLALGESLALVGSTTSLTATVRNLSDTPRTEVSVELLAAGRRIEERTIPALAPRAEATLVFNYRFSTAGQETLEARLTKSNDALDIDDRRWLVAAVRDRFRTLCVAGKPNSADFVATAAAPRREADAAFEAQIVSTSMLQSGLNLDDFDVIALCNVPPLGNEELQRLSEFVRRGGGLLWLLGDMADPNAYGVMLAGDLASLLPAALVQQSPWDTYAVDPLDFKHAILEPFRGQQDTTLARTPIQRYVQLSLPPRSTSETVLRVAPTGDPLIIAGRHGAGRVVAFATDGSLSSIDPTTKEPWTYWPVWQSFVPVVQEALRYAAAGRDERLNTLVGLPITGPLPSGQRASRIVVRPPNASHEPVAAAIVDDDAGQRWTFAETTTSGVYSVDSAASASDAANSPNRFAVNVDTGESDLARATRDDLPDGMVVSLDAIDAPTEQEIVTTGRRDWHVPLLCGLLALIVLESLCAWLLGRRMA
jgi:uncharacterized membrane protein